MFTQTSLTYKSQTDLASGVDRKINIQVHKLRNMEKQFKDIWGLE